MSVSTERMLKVSIAKTGYRRRYRSVETILVIPIHLNYTHWYNRYRSVEMGHKGINPIERNTVLSPNRETFTSSITLVCYSLIMNVSGMSELIYQKNKTNIMLTWGLV